jgi:hypothetical protein
MTKHTQICAVCSATVSCVIHHLGFSDMDAVYCSMCPKVLLLDDRPKNDTQFPNLVAGDEGWKEFDRHLLPYFLETEKQFPLCSCGGSFKFMNPPRCPKCFGFILGEEYEDKPIKRNNGYVYITKGSISLKKLKLQCGWQENT